MLPRIILPCLQTCKKKKIVSKNFGKNYSPKNTK
jgi:hypothetical protein